MNKDNTRRKKQHADRIKTEGYHRKQYYISIAAVLLTFGSLCAYIVVSLVQNFNTREALKATQRSVNLADSNFTIENRAWVGTCQTVVSNGLTVYIKNFGKTPAESLCIGYTTLLRNTPPINRPHVNMNKPTSLSPDEETDISFTQILAKEKIVGNCYYGIVTYTDIYGKRDTTEIMFMHNAPNSPQLERIGINRMK
jgi:hypothetical protein